MMLCRVCQDLILANEKYVKCGGACNGKFHETCLALSVIERTVVQLNRNISWRCDSCILRNPTLSNQQRKKAARKFLLTLLCASIALGIVLYIKVFCLNPKSNLDSAAKTPHERKQMVSCIDESSQVPCLVERTVWRALPPKAELPKLSLPVNRVIITSTSTYSCSSIKYCSHRVRIIQVNQMNILNCDDIAYNFLIGSDGRVYVGRGWYHQGSHTKGNNRDTYGIALIGQFRRTRPSQQQLLALKILLEEGVLHQLIASDYTLKGARLLVDMDSPVRSALKIIERHAWLAQPPKNPLMPLTVPVPNVILLNTGTDCCDSQASCTFLVRFLQTFLIESSQQDDIAYNFLVGGDGNVYEGRGWDFQGALPRRFNNNSISVAHIGSSNGGSNDKQGNSSNLLLELGVKLGKLSQDFELNDKRNLK